MAGENRPDLALSYVATLEMIRRSLRKINAWADTLPDVGEDGQVPGLTADLLDCAEAVRLHLSDAVEEIESFD